MSSVTIFTSVCATAARVWNAHICTLICVRTHPLLIWLSTHIHTHLYCTCLYIRVSSLTLCVYALWCVLLHLIAQCHNEQRIRLLIAVENGRVYLSKQANTHAFNFYFFFLFEESYTITKMCFNMYTILMWLTTSSASPRLYTTHVKLRKHIPTYYRTRLLRNMQQRRVCMAHFTRFVLGFSVSRTKKQPS